MLFCFRLLVSKVKRTDFVVQLTCPVTGRFGFPYGDIAWSAVNLQPQLTLNNGETSVFYLPEGFQNRLEFFDKYSYNNPSWAGRENEEEWLRARSLVAEQDRPRAKKRMGRRNGGTLGYFSKSLPSEYFSATPVRRKYLRVRRSPNLNHIRPTSLEPSSLYNNLCLICFSFSFNGMPGWSGCWRSTPGPQRLWTASGPPE